MKIKKLDEAYMNTCAYNVDGVINSIRDKTRQLISVYNNLESSPVELSKYSSRTYKNDINKALAAFQEMRECINQQTAIIDAACSHNMYGNMDDDMDYDDVVAALLYGTNLCESIKEIVDEEIKVLNKAKQQITIKRN